MIQVNLLPGGKKRPARGRKMAIPMPKLGGLSQDRWVLGAIAAGVVVLLGMGYLWWSVGAEREDVEVALDAARQDSARYADLISRTNALLARRDSIVQKVAIIQEIDQGRYVWPHILDEVARALPDYTWLTMVQQVSSGAEPRILIRGEAGHTFALTAFMRGLEASPFLRDVRLQSSTDAVTGTNERQQIVSQFDLEVSFEQPPMEFLETVPLLGGATEGASAEPTGR